MTNGECSEDTILGELLIKFEKTSTSPLFWKNVERFLCLRFFSNSLSKLEFKVFYKYYMRYFWI